MGDRERALRLMIFVLERLVIALSVIVLTDELAMTMETHRKRLEPQTAQQRIWGAPSFNWWETPS